MQTNTANSGLRITITGFTLTPTLPLAVRQKLDHTLSQWRQWQVENTLRAAPKIEGLLSQGHSNFSILVRGDNRYVVRIDGINPASHGINRQTELHILREASKAGLAPPPRYFNPELGALVCDYLEPDAEQRASAGEIGKLLAKIHRLKVRHQRLNLQQRILRYEIRVQKSASHVLEQLEEASTLVRDLLQTANSSDHTSVLCHNDLLQANRLTHKRRLYAIDWEYSAMGSPWYDLAVLLEGDNVGDNAAREIILGYLDREASTGEKALIEKYRIIYRYLEILWYATAEHSTPADIGLVEKIAFLNDKLNLSP